MSTDLKHLTSGSDIRGYALKTENGPEPELTPEVAEKVGYALAEWYKNKFGKDLEKAAVGRDSRVTGPELLKAFAKGLSEAGAEVLDVELATSPAMFMITQEKDKGLDIAAMITASHMPMDRNGIKIVTPEGGLSHGDVEEILTIAEGVTPTGEGKEPTLTPYIPDYAAKLVETVRQKTGQERPLENAKIVVDAGNGAGGFFASEVLEPLGADTSGSRYLEPDGTFPNHIPNPEAKEAIESIINAVLENEAQMGIIFDTDVDRSAIIDEKGNPINKSAFIAFISSLLLDENPGATIVTDSVTSTGLTDFIEQKGGKHHRFKRGYKNVIDEAKRLNKEGENTVLAMETSGHGAVKDNYFLDDGAYLAVLSLVALSKALEEGKQISDYLSDYHYPLEEEEIRLTITDPDYVSIGQGLLEDFEKFAEEQPGWTITQPNYEGVRVEADEDNGNGWVLVRQSLHEPKIPINIESDTEGGVDVIKTRLDEFLSNYDNLEA